MKKILLFFLIYSSGLIAQSPSVYSSFGIGELNVNPTARKSGFGLGIAQADPFDINPFNPAGNGKIQFVKFSGSLNYSINSYSDNKSKNKFQTGQFENLLIAFPIQRDYGVVFAGGITPFTRVKYKVLSPQNFFDSISYQTTYEGIGGITDYSAGLSYLIKNAGYIGLQVDFLIGTITRKLSTDFKNTYYINQVLSFISSNWYRPPSPEGTSCTIYFVISKQGRIIDAKVEKSSENSAFDRAALRAVLASNPLPPLPYDFYGEKLGIHLSFQ